MGRRLTNVDGRVAERQPQGERVLQFLLFTDGKRARHLDLSSAYLFGSDGVPLRAELEFKNGAVVCNKRSAGPAGLALLWPVEGVGEVVVETVRLQERDEPFVLPLELARGHLMHLSHKVEDWGLFDCVDAEPLNARVAAARERLIQAMQADDPVQVSRAAEQALAEAARSAEV